VTTTDIVSKFEGIQSPVDTALIIEEIVGHRLSVTKLLGIAKLLYYVNRHAFLAGAISESTEQTFSPDKRLDPGMMWKQAVDKYKLKTKARDFYE